MFVKLVLVLFCCVEFGTAIRCFECTSSNNSMCIEPRQYDPETLRHFLPVTECRQGVQAVAPEGDFHFFCRKIEQTILRRHLAPELRVTRGCGWRKHDYKDCYKADNEDHLETVCQCFTDECNYAHATSSSAIAVVLVGFCAWVFG